MSFDGTLTTTTLPPREARDAAIVVLAAMDSEFRSATEIAYRARMPWRRVSRLLCAIGSAGPVESRLRVRSEGKVPIRVWRKR